jgi:hypothetical protein
MRSSQVEIASPCHESWDAMNGDDARRFCGICQKDVHNLSAMAHAEATALLRENAGAHLCVRYTSEADGTLRFRDLVPRAALTRKIVRTAFAATMLAACTPYGDGPAVQDLGQEIIESIREATVPTADGGCDYTTGPFTTFHLPPGHVLCKGAGSAIADPISVPMMGAPLPIQIDPPPQPPPQIQDPIMRPKMGEAVALPEVKDPFVPCDPQPGFAPPPPGIQPETHELMGDVAAPPPPKPPKRNNVRMGDISPEPPAELMGKIAPSDD